MGRPLKKKFFGDPADPGSQFTVTYWNGTAAVTGYIVKQKGSRRFLCTDDANPAVCNLSTEAVTEGLMNLTMDGQLVKKITGRIAILADDTRYAWIDSDVEAPPAPPSPISITALVNGTEYTITTAGDSDFTLVGAADSIPGTVFTASGPGTGTGTATPT